METSIICSAAKNYGRTNFKGIERSKNNNYANVFVNGAGNSMGIGHTEALLYINNELSNSYTSKHAPMDIKKSNMIGMNLGNAGTDGSPEALYNTASTDQGKENIVSLFKDATYKGVSLADDVDLSVETDAKTKQVYLVGKNKASGKKATYELFATRSLLDYNKLNVDIVSEASGKATKAVDLQKHVAAGATYAVATAPGKDKPELPHFIPGINTQNRTNVINKTKEAGGTASTASCTTTGSTAIIKAMVDEFGADNINMVTVYTVHSITGTQPSTDKANITKAQGKNNSSYKINPESSGAAKAIVKVMPELKGKVSVGAVRVPSTDASLLKMDFYINTPEELKDKSEDEMTAYMVDMFNKKTEEPGNKHLLARARAGSCSADANGELRSAMWLPDQFKVNREKSNGQDRMVVSMQAYYDNIGGYTRSHMEFLNMLADDVVKNKKASSLNVMA